MENDNVDTILSCDDELGASKREIVDCIKNMMLIESKMRPSAADLSCHFDRNKKLVQRSASSSAASVQTVPEITDLEDALSQPHVEYEPTKTWRVRDLIINRNNTHVNTGCYNDRDKY